MVIGMFGNVKTSRFVGLISRVTFRYNETHTHFTQDYQNKLMLADATYDRLYYEIQQTINYGN